MITQKQKDAIAQAAERAVEEFERTSLISEVQHITDGHGFWFGVWQGLVAAFFYSVALVIIALIIKQNGIDIIHALVESAK